MSTSTTYIETVLLEKDQIYGGVAITHDNLVEVYKHFNSLQTGIYGATNPSDELNFALDEFTHQVERVYFKDDSDPNLYCTIKLLDTLNGRIVQSLVERGMQYSSQTILMGLIDGAELKDPMLHAVHLYPAHSTYKTVSVPLKEL